MKFGTRFSVVLLCFAYTQEPAGVTSIHGSCLRLDTQTDGQIVYADMEVQIHKTMRASANRFKFLDLVVSGIGMAGHNWIEHWLEALRYLGMDPLNGVVGLSLMPAPGDDGQMRQRSLESD